MISSPPRSSFVSAYGPSVTATLPFLKRRLTVASGPCSPSPETQCPFFLSVSSYAKQRSIIASCSAGGIVPHFSASRYPVHTNFMIRLLSLFFHYPVVV